jgi:predicted RNase H-like HicB family nuclease
MKGRKQQPAEERKPARAGNLAEFFAASPLRGSGLKIKCINDHPRRAYNPPMRYKVLLKQSKEGFSVSCPGLPGCWSQGSTETEALENIGSAIREYLAGIEKLAKESEFREVEITV